VISLFGGEGEELIIKVQGDTKKRELLKCVVAAMYSWQHCGTGDLEVQPCHLVIMDQWNGQHRAVAIHFFNLCWVFQKFPVFFVSPCIYSVCIKFLDL
jgi:hypothetical protein